MIKPDLIARVREAVDIVELIGEYVPLKKVGTRYRGLCPFHLEKNPSFYVDPQRQIYHCFGCGEGGTAISFLMKYEKILFPEAVRILASRVGIRLEEERRTREEPGIYEVMEFAANLFTSYLYYYPKPLKYLRERKIGQEVQKRFRLGYAPGGGTLLKEAKKKGHPVELLLAAGLVVERDGKYEDFFFSRLIFPVFSPSGRIIGFGGRTLEEGVEPKYLNSPETEVFKKGENLYGFFQAKKELKSTKPILVEGYFDLLSLAEAWINNCLAPLGTAFTISQALLVKRYNKDIYISFDGDAQGREAAKKASVVALKAGLHPLIVSLPEGYDPDKFIREKGRDAFLSLLPEALDLIDFLLSDKDRTKISERREIINQFQEIIPEIGDEVLKDLYINKASEVLGVRREIFRTKQVLRKEKSELRPSFFKEEKLLSYILLVPEYARLCRQVLPTSVFPAEYSRIVNLLYNLCDKDFTISEFCDLLEDVKDKNLVSRLCFREEQIPEKESFIFLLKRVLVDFLKKEANKDENKLKEFLEIKRDLIRKRGGSFNG